MPIWYRTGIKWRHPKNREGASPEIVPPLGIMVFIPLAAIWLPISLVYSFGAELDVPRQILLALFGGVAPIAIAYGVMTNRQWTRLVILATVLINIWVYAAWRGVPLSEQLGSNRSFVMSLFVWVALALYFYSWKTSRAYYGILSGKPLPDELKNLDWSPPKALAFLMGHLAAISEWVLILLAFAIFFGLLFFWNQKILPL
jgi:hypothetical protein